MYDIRMIVPMYIGGGSELVHALLQPSPFFGNRDCLNVFVTFVVNILFYVEETDMREEYCQRAYR